ncbi:AbiH family protein [Arcticibacter tournemirensis]
MGFSKFGANRIIIESPGTMDNNKTHKPINRLILLGNGFDLAHGMKTSYTDFILWYLGNCFDQALTKGSYEDSLIKIRYPGNRLMLFPEVKTAKDYVQILYEIGFKNIKRKVIKLDGYKERSNPFEVSFPSPFFFELIDKCSTVRWVDIENEYYRFLKTLSFSDSDRSKVIKDLNKKLAYIITLLEGYLSHLPEPDLINDFFSILGSPFRQNEFHTSDKIPRDQIPDTSLVLNFNYTQTPERYFSPQKNAVLKGPIKFNYIHGQCRNPENSIIFGFGDELDKDYERLEAIDSKEIFSYFKSFSYFKTSNYYNLVRFIDDTDFQVYIMGHSCGLSDRTMLNMIFEHPNCKSIKIFYYEHEGENNFTEITQEISRHFRNKQEMRRKIVSFDKSLPMPQHICITV